MKAKCPYCDYGCHYCDAGLLDCSYPSGDDVTFHETVCKDCSTPCGGQFTWKERPEAKISPYAICPACGGKNLELVQRG